MQIVETTPDEYLASLPPEVGAEMAQFDQLISGAMPGRSRLLWEGVFWGGTQQQIIGYGDLVQPRPRGPEVRWFVVGLARQKSGTSVYVNAAAGKGYLLADYKGRLGRVKTGSAVINIASWSDLDVENFTELIGRANELCPPNPA